MQPTTSTSLQRNRHPVASIVFKLLQGHEGNLEIRLWDGTKFQCGTQPPEAALVFLDPRPLRETALSRDPLRLLDAYFRGLIDIEGDIYAALKLERHFESLKLLTIGNFLNFARVILQSELKLFGKEKQHSPRLPQHRLSGIKSISDNREAIAFHYDVSNDFYRLWLDKEMVYSCAYFEHPGEDLDQAQRNKLDYICRKLRLQPGERLLDIGCGWGALVCWAAKHHGVHALGVTLSRNQFEYAQQVIQEQGLQDRVTVELRDYRDIGSDKVFEKIVSVGMFEHVGLKNLPLYFKTAHQLLAPGGLFLNHGITHDEEGWNKTLSTQFINRYVFPGGELDTVSNVQRVAENSGFEIWDVEALRPHYALTLRHWVQRLERHKNDALKHVTESVYRTWRLYMAACALHFEKGDIGIYQILASKKNDRPAAAPMTRRDLYS